MIARLRIPNPASRLLVLPCFTPETHATYARRQYKILHFGADAVRYFVKCRDSSHDLALIAFDRTGYACIVSSHSLPLSYQQDLHYLIQVFSKAFCSTEAAAMVEECRNLPGCGIVSACILLKFYAIKIVQNVDALSRSSLVNGCFGLFWGTKVLDARRWRDFARKYQIRSICPVLKLFDVSVANESP